MAVEARETLEQRVERLRVRRRDCRDCKLFTPSPAGLAFGWCSAHTQFVKLYHGSFFSQCQFKVLARPRGTENGVA
ncbi:MAG TPA: hypothetical protein VGB83_08675 [Actinomycetota bacterium]